MINLAIRYSTFIPVKHVIMKLSVAEKPKIIHSTSRWFCIYYETVAIHSSLVTFDALMHKEAMERKAEADC